MTILSCLAFGMILQRPPLWEIGTKDGDDREYALAPSRYRDYREDPVFVVGRDAAKDLPYVHPGPIDGWAGGRSHVFTFVFSARQVHGQASRVTLDLVDAQDQWPPSLSVSLNGHAQRTWTSRGAGDASVFGAPEKGRPQTVAVRFPVGALREGANVLRIENDQYSWLIYDHIAFEAGDAELGMVTKPILIGSPQVPPVLDRTPRGLKQPVEIQVLDPTDGGSASLEVDGKTRPVTLQPGVNRLRAWVPAVQRSTPAAVRLVRGREVLASVMLEIRPVRRWTVYLIPHTHVDVGYTEAQPKVEQKQWRSLSQVLDLIDKTSSYPDSAKFRWQIEGLWPVESWLKSVSAKDRKRFFEGIGNGRIGLNAIYANELTGLCTYDELKRWAGYGRKLFGQAADSAIISDVPGYVWGVVPALHEAGVKYFSFGMNDSARLGTALSAWGDRPFYWQAPAGKAKILCWSAGKGYPWFHRLDISRDWTPALFDYLGQLEREKLPYDLIHIPYTKGDNGPPDPALPEFVRKWNAEHAYPRLVIATVSQSMRELERRYGAKIPVVKGDFTPYWEDGAASSARETALARNASNRLTQARDLWELSGKKPDRRFDDAWREVLLFNEHTWGAYNSISDPDAPGVLEQWGIKRGFAEMAQAKSAALIEQELKPGVTNTLPWPRREVVLSSRSASDRSQKLRNGSFAVLVNVPARRTSSLRPMMSVGRVRVGADWLDNGRVRVAINPSDGSIKSLRWHGQEFAAPGGLNRYLYVRGTDPKAAVGSSQAKVLAGEGGPLVGSLILKSDAPGCRSLVREIRLVADSDRIEVFDTVDKLRVTDKEGVHFAFPFAVTGGQMRLNIPGAVIRPERDQIAGACKNWFSVERWADVSNERFGVTWVTLDAPLVEIGGITAETAWIEHLKPTQTLISYVMNNYWFTNYRAYQEGSVTFRYVLLPHGPYSRRQAEQFAMSLFQPLLVRE